MPMIRYFDIAWLSDRDGPGHRAVLFLQGCPLRCPWCHSPHSQPPRSPLLFFPARCTYCGRCKQACSRGVHQVEAPVHILHRENCQACGACLDACRVSSRNQFSGALVLPTREAIASDLWELLKPQLEVLRHAGGLTVSGGEPLLQSGSLRELLHFCRNAGFHTAVETCGAVARRHFLDIQDLVDCWLFGYRPTRFYVPPGTELLEENLTFLAGTDTPIIVRTPIIPGVTDLPESLDRIVRSMQANRLNEIELLPFHHGTPHYYRALDKSFPMEDVSAPTREQLDASKDYLERHGLMVRVVH
jgi:glycyl-radical enzyme activating protein